MWDSSEKRNIFENLKQWTQLFYYLKNCNIADWQTKFMEIIYWETSKVISNNKIILYVYTYIKSNMHILDLHHSEAYEEVNGTIKNLTLLMSNCFEHSTMYPYNNITHKSVPQKEKQ